MRNPILISIQAILIVFILSYTISAKGVEQNPIEISGTVLCSDKHSTVTEGFIKIIVYNRNTNEINLIRFVPVTPEGKFNSGKIHLNTGDGIRIGAYANDVTWDHGDNIIINNNQQTDLLEIGAYANDIGDNLLSIINNQDDMIEVDLESDLDNITIYAERKNNESDNGEIDFIGTYPRNPILHQNHPNPFNPVTNINFSIAENTFVSIKIYDITGREIAILVNETKSSGNYSVIFDGSNLNSGFYFYQIIAGDYQETKKMSLLK